VLSLFRCSTLHFCLNNVFWMWSRCTDCCTAVKLSFRSILQWWYKCCNLITQWWYKCCIWGLDKWWGIVATCTPCMRDMYAGPPRLGTASSSLLLFLQVPTTLKLPVRVGLSVWLWHLQGSTWWSGTLLFCCSTCHARTKSPTIADQFLFCPTKCDEQYSLRFFYFQGLVKVKFCKVW
jgi:hypothetical protein